VAFFIHLPVAKNRRKWEEWYEAFVEVLGERRKLYCFAMRSMASGGAFHRAYYHATQQAFLEAHELAFDYFGALALGCTDAAAVRHLASADELNRPRREPFPLGALECYDRPLPRCNAEEYVLFVGKVPRLPPPRITRNCAPSRTSNYFRRNSLPPRTASPSRASSTTTR